MQGFSSKQGLLRHQSVHWVSIAVFEQTIRLGIEVRGRFYTKVNAKKG